MYVVGGLLPIGFGRGDATFVCQPSRNPTSEMTRKISDM